MLPAENWAAKNLPGPFDGTRERRILLQGEMCASAIIIFHVRQQQVAEVAFAEHDNVVEAFPSDRTDQSFGIPPRRLARDLADGPAGSTYGYQAWDWDGIVVSF
jgi:hypothetical protein